MHTHKASDDDGLTLIECLVALTVIALTVVTIAPMMVFSVATRVQNQKTEQALRLARGEIDKIRLTVEQGGDYSTRLEELSLISSKNSSPLVDVKAPYKFVANDPAAVTDIRFAREIDIDADGDTDFAVQLFRDEGIEVGPESVPIAFNVGVRVYDVRAAANFGDLLEDSAGLAFTSGEGQRGRRPLAVLYSQITQGDRISSLCQAWEFAGSTPTDLQC
ncbi:MAG: prepilin-type N-terminal cleavage/methylation domain-containing protein [Bacteroidota bacterium]